MSTVAVVSDTNVILEELAPKSVEYEKRIKELQRKIDRSKRITNPDNYNTDGTIKRGGANGSILKTAIEKCVNSLC